MAENEYLDLGRARRWQRLWQAVLEGQSSEQLSKIACDCLLNTLKSIRKELPVGDFLDSLEKSRYEFEKLVRKYERHDYAQLFRDATIGTRSPQVVMENFISAICNRFFDQIVIKIVRSDGQHTFARVRSQLDQVGAHLKPEMHRIAQRLAVNPNEVLRHSRASVVRGLISIPRILDESLLGRRL